MNDELVGSQQCIRMQFFQCNLQFSAIPAKVQEALYWLRIYNQQEDAKVCVEW